MKDSQNTTVTENGHGIQAKILKEGNNRLFFIHSKSFLKLVYNLYSFIILY